MKKTLEEHFLWCEDYVDNFKLQEVKMTNKVFREKSYCVVCGSSESRLIKQKHNNKNKLTAQLFKPNKKQK